MGYQTTMHQAEDARNDAPIHADWEENSRSRRTCSGEKQRRDDAVQTEERTP